MSELLSELLNSTESDYLDFKEKWYEQNETYKFIHDIICLSNAVCENQNRYIVIGVDDDKETYKKTLCNAHNNIKTSEEITQMLQHVMSKIPTITVLKEVVENNDIYIIQITPNYIDLPYVLNKPIEYEVKDKNGKIKKKRLIKNSIYSRINSRNTPKDESCDIETVKKIIAIQKGDNLDINEKFEMYLDDVENWQKTGNNYYYLKDSNFKIVRIDSDENIRYFNKIQCYHEIVVDTCISKEYWDFNSLNYDDYYQWFDVNLYANNTLIKTTQIMEFFSKHFFPYKSLKSCTYFLPTRDGLKINYKPMKIKNDILNTFEWKLCKIFFKCDMPHDIKISNRTAEDILDNLNYEFLEDCTKYTDENKDWIWKNPKDNN